MAARFSFSTLGMLRKFAMLRTQQLSEDQLLPSQARRIRETLLCFAYPAGASGPHAQSVSRILKVTEGHDRAEATKPSSHFNTEGQSATAR
jgi:hypothetical protein